MAQLFQLLLCQHAVKLRFLISVDEGMEISCVVSANKMGHTGHNPPVGVLLQHVAVCRLKAASHPTGIYLLGSAVR